MLGEPAAQRALAEPVAGEAFAALPLYDLSGVQGANDQLWHCLNRHAVALGLTPPPALDRKRPYRSLWTDAGLVFAQACGLPLVTTLGSRARVLATPVYRFVGCEGPQYRSVLLVRAEAPIGDLGDLRRARVAINGWDSHSGCNALGHLVAPLAARGAVFAQIIETGAHVESLRAVREGRADLCAVDCITLGLVEAYEPERLAGLRTLAVTAAAPTPPYVISGSASDAELSLWREALSRAFTDPRSAAARAMLGLIGFEILPRQAYDVIAEMAATARVAVRRDLA